VFDAARDRFLINVRDPACVVALSAGTGVITAQIAVSGVGPHGLDLDTGAERAFVAHTTAFDARRQVLSVFLPASCRAAVCEELNAG
jgi:hypothetical protein